MCHTRSYDHRQMRARRRDASTEDRPDAPAPSREPGPDRVAQRVATGPLRVGDAERERAATLLRDHAAAGRLDADELGERLERAY